MDDSDHLPPFSTLYLSPNTTQLNSFHHHHSPTSRLPHSHPSLYPVTFFLQLPELPPCSITHCSLLLLPLLSSSCLLTSQITVLLRRFSIFVPSAIPYPPLEYRTTPPVRTLNFHGLWFLYVPHAPANILFALSVPNSEAA